MTNLKKIFKLITLPFKTMLNKLISMEPRHIALIIMAGLLIGIYLNSKNPIKNFFIIEFLGAIVVLISTFMFKRISDKKNTIITSVSTEPKLSVLIKKFYANNEAPLDYVIGISIGFFYVYIAYNLHFVHLNPVGIYCLFALVTVCVFMTKMALIYIQLIIIFYKINNLEKIPHNKLGVKKTYWLIEINYLCNVSRNCLLIAMSLMFMVFALFSPSNTFEIIRNYDYGNKQATFIIIYWAIAILLVFISLPSLTFVQNKLLNKIVTKINDDSIKEYELILVDKERKSDVEDALSVIAYISSISEKYIYENRIKYISLGYCAINGISAFLTIISNYLNLIRIN